jgi:hypothetical protein
MSIVLIGLRGHLKEATEFAAAVAGSLGGDAADASTEASATTHRSGMTSRPFVTRKRSHLDKRAARCGRRVVNCAAAS